MLVGHWYIESVTKRDVQNTASDGICFCLFVLSEILSQVMRLSANVNMLNMCGQMIRGVCLSACSLV